MIHSANEKKTLLGVGDRRGRRNPNEIVLLDIAVFPLPIAAHRLSDPLALELDAVFETSDSCTPLPQERHDLPTIPPSLLTIPIQLGKVLTRLDPSLLLGTFLDVSNERDECLDRLHASPKDVTNQPPARRLPSALPSVRGRERHR